MHLFMVDVVAMEIDSLVKLNAFEDVYRRDFNIKNNKGQGSFFFVVLCDI